MSRKKKKHMGKHNPAVELIENEDSIAKNGDVVEEASKPEAEGAKAEGSKAEESKTEERKSEESKTDSGDSKKTEDASSKEADNAEEKASEAEEKKSEETKDEAKDESKDETKTEDSDAKGKKDTKENEKADLDEAAAKEAQIAAEGRERVYYKGPKEREPWDEQDILQQLPKDDNEKSSKVMLMESALEKRMNRKKRRKRNQTVAYLTLILVLILLATGTLRLVNILMDMKDGKSNNQVAESSQVEELLTSEEEIEVPSEEVASSEVVPEEPELTYEEKLDELVNAGIEVMPIEDKVAGLFLVSPEAITGVDVAIQAGDGTKEALAQNAVGGIVYNKKNMKSAEQLKEMIQNTKEFSKYPLFIAATEEGGPVSNLHAAELVDSVMGAQEIGQAGEASKAYEAGTLIGTYMEEFGFNLDMGPVVDLATNEDSNMYARSYGTDGTTVSAYAGNMIQGLKEHQVAACIKHFPGAGSAVKSEDNGRAHSSQTAEEFAAADLVPFQALVNDGVDMIMVSSMLSSAWDEKEIPCCFSASVVKQILREQMGYDGVIITDALNEQGITDYYAADEAAVMALKAGCDMIYMPEDYEQAYQGVLKAVEDGVISKDRIDDALRRIYRIKYASMVTE